jgi:hypothetical protein
MGLASSPTGIIREGKRHWSPTSAPIHHITRAIEERSTDTHAHGVQDEGDERQGADNADSSSDTSFGLC